MNILYFTEVFVYSGLETLERKREKRVGEERVGRKEGGKRWRERGWRALYHYGF